MLDAKRISGDSLGPYVRNVDVQWDSVNTDNLPEMDFPLQERDRYRLQPGDLLVCEGGEVGRTAIWQDEMECFYQKAIHRVRPKSQRDAPRFFYYVMYSLARRGVFLAEGNPNTISHLTAVQLRHYRVVFPPLSEQQAISEHLDSETAKLDALITKNPRSHRPPERASRRPNLGSRHRQDRCSRGGSVTGGGFAPSSGLALRAVALGSRLIYI